MSTSFVVTQTARTSSTLTAYVRPSSTEQIADPCAWVSDPVNKTAILASLNAPTFLYVQSCSLVVVLTTTAGYTYELQAVFSSAPASSISSTSPASATISVDTVRKASSSVLIAL